MGSLQAHHHAFVDRARALAHGKPCSLRVQQSPRNRLSRRRRTATVGFKDGTYLSKYHIRKGILGIVKTHGDECICQHPCEKLGLPEHTFDQRGARSQKVPYFPLAGVAEVEQERQSERLPERRVPQTLEEVDNGQILGFGADLAEDHPGYLDQAYKDRRRDIGNLARAHKVGEPVPRLEYTAEELHVWATVLRELKDLYPQHACAEFLRCLPLFRFNEHEVRIGPPEHSTALVSDIVVSTQLQTCHSYLCTNLQHTEHRPLHACLVST